MVVIAEQTVILVFKAVAIIVVKTILPIHVLVHLLVHYLVYTRVVVVDLFFFSNNLDIMMRGFKMFIEDYRAPIGQP